MVKVKLRDQVTNLEMEKNVLVQGKNNLETKIEELKNQHSIEVEQVNKNNKIEEENKKQEYDIKITELGESIENLNRKLKEKQNQLDRKELKKLASAYKEQEDDFNSETKKWLKRLTAIAVVLLVYGIISIFITEDKELIESISYYFIDIMLFSAVWFCSSQYSNALNLKYDYANRKTLAQSFHNILNNLAEDQEIKNKFIEKTTDILCAGNLSGGKESLLSKKVLKDVAELIGAATKR